MCLPPGSAGLQPGPEFKAALQSGPKFPAGPEPGAPRRLPGWYSRGYLPHRDEINLLQAITFRLADALPDETLRRLEEQLALQPASGHNITRRLQMEHWLDSGFGCRALGHPKVAAIMENALLHFDGTRYRLLAWCIMPNHVHVLIRPGQNLAAIVRSWKSFTGRWALAHGVELGLSIPGKVFWMREYWDRYIRDDAHHRRAIDYIHQNPVKAGLCDKAEAWPWSSARRARGDA